MLNFFFHLNSYTLCVSQQSPCLLHCKPTSQCGYICKLHKRKLDMILHIFNDLHMIGNVIPLILFVGIITE